MYIQYLHIKASQWFVRSFKWLNGFFFIFPTAVLSPPVSVSLPSVRFTHFNPSVTSNAIAVCPPTPHHLAPYRISLQCFHCGGHHRSTLHISNPASVLLFCFHI